MIAWARTTYPSSEVTEHYSKQRAEAEHADTCHIMHPTTCLVIHIANCRDALEHGNAGNRHYFAPVNTTSQFPNAPNDRSRFLQHLHDTTSRSAGEREKNLYTRHKAMPCRLPSSRQICQYNMLSKRATVSGRKLPSNALDRAASTDQQLPHTAAAARHDCCKMQSSCSKRPAC
jgi:hypothetical protein